MSRFWFGLIVLIGFVASKNSGTFADDKKPKPTKEEIEDTLKRELQTNPPRSTDPRLKIELFADSLQIVTPTGIDVDRKGRVWAIESNTHFPPEGYAGHPTDRIQVLEDTDADGKADKVTVFKDGLTHSMSIAVKPIWLDIARFDDTSNPNTVKPVTASASKVTEVYIATRRDIFLCTDTDGDLKCDDTKLLVHLETTGNYPHNGLAGFAFDAFGNMYFGFGENLGVDYKLIGSDKVTLSGGGEGGNIYRCLPDGSRLEQWSTGFWNPHASCIDAFGRMFTVDNDPDSRPPCRLLHIVQGGDYGYRFRNGRKGTHPFTSWNGEIPGTLPMVSGTGEAPSGILSYESDDFPEDYRGTLFVGSWGDHRIDQFVLKPRGTSFVAIPHPIITGGENFRPVGLAVAPDGTLFVTDWVLKEYKIHGQGRIWRVSAKDKPKRNPPTVDGTDVAQSVRELVEALDSPVLNTRRLAAKRLAQSEEGRKELDRIRRESESGSRRHFEVARAGVEYVEPPFYLDLSKDDLTDPFVLLKVINHAADLFPRMIHRAVMPSLTEDSLQQMLAEVRKLDPSVVERTPHESEYCHIAVLLALRKTFPKDVTFAQLGLRSIIPSVRRVAVQWIGEEKIGALRPDLERVLASEPMTTELFKACLASLSLLDGVTPKEYEKTPPAQYILAIVTDTARPASLRAIALRMLPPAQKELDAKLLGEMLTSNEPALKVEAVRTLQHSPIPEREQLLRGIAANESLDLNLRADAVAGLAGVDHHANLDDDTRELLLKLAMSEKLLPIRLEAIRSLRGFTSATKETAPRDPKVQDALRQLLSAVSRESEPARKSLTDALEFNVGPRKPPASKELLAEFSASPQDDGLKLPPPRDNNAIEAGRRAFFQTNGAGCYKCHQIGGRGGQVGPDLTVIARTMDRKKLAESILDPSKEISPQFTTWTIETKNGKTLTGMLLGEEVNGDLRLGNNLGEVFFVPFNEIETRTPMKTSIMPEKLHETMSNSEFHNLIRFLETLN